MPLLQSKTGFFRKNVHDFSPRYIVLLGKTTGVYLVLSMHVLSQIEGS